MAARKSAIIVRSKASARPAQKRDPLASPPPPQQWINGGEPCARNNQKPRMNTVHASSRTVSASSLASFSALLAVTVGVMVLVGWTFDIALLKSILPGWVSMKANTAAWVQGISA